jgi:uncharacterized glyoxalase superfamily protein PhnB
VRAFSPRPEDRLGKVRRQPASVESDGRRIDDVGSKLDRIKELGGSPVMRPMDMPNGSTTGLFTDPEGYVIGVHTPPG